MVFGKNSILPLSAGIVFGFGLCYMLLMSEFNTSPAKRTTASNFIVPVHYNAIVDTSSVREDPVRVLCWVMTSPTNHVTKAKYVKETWGKRCDKLLFMSTQNDTELGAIGLPNIKESRDWLWQKTKDSFKYIWDHHRDDADWFMKADDDTYVILENLRFMLSQYNSSDPIYFGCKMKLPDANYMSGGAGYVLSKEAVRRFVEIGLNNSTYCYPPHFGSEDKEIGKCLEGVGVVAGNSLDEKGLHRFLPMTPTYHLHEPVNGTWWLWEYFVHPPGLGFDCCSDSAIAFHYIQPHAMMTMDYLIYHLTAHGLFYKVDQSSNRDSSYNFSRFAG